ncbi:MAG: ATP-binding protein [Gammaproteobacteria bacterium]|nr:ATP-binding protein [Gammaproteobacteria bacterium]MBU1723231.1 ATP-binding protein [Gammaproteobacteria bacterium]MBU2007256.1 ATP-binding protein [Gammaproteobacteria bacterium]
MLDSLHIKNFRCFEDLTIPSLGQVNLIVGKNSVGKSTLLEAIAIFSSAADRQTINFFREFRDSYSSTSSTDDDQLIELLPHKNQELMLEIGDIRKIQYVTIMPKSIAIEKFPDFPVEESSSYSRRRARKDNKFVIISLKNNLINLTSIPHYYSGTHLENTSELERIWAAAFKNSKKKLVINALKIINKSINDLAFIPEEIYENDFPRDQKLIRIPMVKLDDQDQAVPLRSLGEGTLRLLQIILAALQAENGFLLIDEFENGLHYSIQGEVWEKLFKLAKELDIQVFATTHSEDTVKAFCKVSLHSPEEGHLISLGRSAYGEDKGKIIAIVHDENDLQYILDTGMEVR